MWTAERMADLRARAACTYLPEALDEIARLTATVDQLDRTADGVPMVPGMHVWCNGDSTYDNGAVMRLLATQRQVDFCFRGPVGTFLGQIYSTQTAAEAAAKAES